MNSIFQPKRTFRCVLASQWPSSFTGAVVFALGMILIIRGTELRWVGIGLLGFVVYGVWRAWNVKLTISSSTVTVLNPIRSYRIEPDGDSHFRLTVIDAVFPAAEGIELVIPGRVIKLMATAALDEGARRRLSAALTRLGETTGSVSSVPPTWRSRW